MNDQSNQERAVRRAMRKGLWKATGLAFLSGLGGGTPVARHPDERIAATAQKWAAVGGIFLSIALAIDIVVRCFILRQDPKEYWDIGLIWMVNLFIVCIGQIRSGIQPVGVERRQFKISILMIVEIAILVPALLWLLGMVHSWQIFLLEAGLAAVSATAMLFIMRALYGRWERREIGANSDAEGQP